MDDDKPFDLRDKFAIEILHALIALPSKGQSNTVPEKFLYYFDDTGDVKKSCGESMERMIRAAYKIADLMRKVRLSAFE